MQRIQWIDFAKGAALVFVIISHASATQLNAYLSFGSVPAFFVISGFLLNLSKWGQVGQFVPFVVKLVKRLIVPFYLAELLWYPLWLLRNALPGQMYPVLNPLLPAQEALKGILLGNGALLPLSPLWFLPSLFLAEIIFLALWRLLRRRELPFVAAIILCSYLGLELGKVGQLPLNLDIALTAQILLLAGNLINRFAVAERLNVFVCAALVGVVWLAINYSGSIDMNMRGYGSRPVLFYAACVAETLLLVKLSIVATEFGGAFADVMKYCGKQTMIVLTAHVLVIDCIYELLRAATGLEYGQMMTSPTIFVPTLIAATFVPLFVAKQFGQKPLIKYFCV